MKKILTISLILILIITLFSSTIFNDYSVKATTLIRSEGINDWNEVHNCFATRTETGYTEGCHALLYPIDESILVTAAAPEFYNSYGINASLAGAYLEVTGPTGKKVNVLVSDEAPEGSLDIYTTAFDTIAKPTDGRINITWRIISRPVIGNFVYSIKDGSSAYWAGIQIRNHRYPVIKMEYYKNEKWNEMNKETYNYFIASGMGSGIIPIRVTDIRGEKIVDSVYIPELSSEKFLQYGHAQFSNR